MKSLKLFGILAIVMVLTLLISACNTYTAPKKYKFVNTRVYTNAYDNIWNRAVEWFASTGNTTKTADKNSGIITTDLLRTADKYCDCGYYDDLFVNHYLVENFKDGISISLNIIIKKLDESSVSVAVSLFAQCKEVTYYKGDVSSRDVHECTSKGTIETQILDFLDGKSIQK